MQRTCSTLQHYPHPNIVPVLDHCLLPDGTLRVVTPALPTVKLAEQIKIRRPAIRESVHTFLQIAAAVQHLHKHGLTHLAIQPGCILIEPDLSVPTLDCSPFPQSPEYFSPEQAADEDHRLDYRSDLYSLGAVFFELLTGTQPFTARTLAELKRQITTTQARSPGSVQPMIPPVLHSVCRGTLQRNRSDRLLTAADIAQTLQQWLLDTSAPSHSPPDIPIPEPLHPLDCKSADTFPELLPGPRCVNRLPTPIARWKSLIEDESADRTFEVALLTGPPGSGKTSFLAAGLLPRLSPEIVTVLIDSSHGNTEQLLLTALRDKLSSVQGLSAALSADDLPSLARTIRRNAEVPQILVVLDHFEHWLHKNENLATAELVFALRQCRGRRLQTILVVSSDALPAAGRLMAELDIQLIQGLNHAIFDMLTVEQATKILVRCGRSSGQLDSNHQLTSAQQQFIQQALEQIQLQGLIPQWQLALLMRVSRDLVWQPASLQILTDHGGP